MATFCLKNAGMSLLPAHTFCQVKRNFFAQLREPQEVPMKSSSPRPVVLIIEDDFDARESFREALEDEGFDIAVAYDGRDAERYLRENTPPAAVVLDLMMPRLDGWAVAAMMRQGRLPNVPTVIVTAAADHWGYPAPPNRVLKKPVRIDALLGAVRAVVAKSPERGSAAGQAPGV